MHCLYAKITPNPEHYDSAKAAILSILDDTRKENGCIQFDIHTDNDASVLFLYEQWVNEAALQNHYEQSYTKSVFESYATWLAKPVEIESFTLLES